MTAPEIIGRYEEKALLDEVSESSVAELVAVYGRRRVAMNRRVRLLEQNKPLLKNK